MGFAGKIMYNPESSHLSADVINCLFDICSSRNFMFRDLALGQFDALKIYRDEQQDASK